MNDLSTVLDTLAQDAKSSREKGARFERIMQRFFLVSPEYADRFLNVWLWDEWPEKKGPDTGIDLVAQEKNGGLCAIQCKFYDRNHTLQKSDIDSFFTASGKKIYSRRLIVSTTDKWSKHAEDAVKDQHIPCNVFRFQDLDTVVHNWETAISQPEKLELKRIKEVYPHQAEAIDAVLSGFKQADRGKLIMACGTGKTFTSLRIAEKQVGPGLVLFVVPSLSLLSQAMREWAYESKSKHSYLAVCSDTKVAKDSEDISSVYLPWPPSTDAKSLARQWEALRRGKQATTVIFSTYQSLGVVSQAQKKLQKSASLNPKQSIFDLVICDEAHRTTGIESPDGKTSLFSQVHRDDLIQARKRLYMTATPRLYTDDAKSKAKDRSIGIYSMDDPKTYGEEFYRLDFSEAVSQGLLSDYKVLVLSVSEKYIAGPLQHLITKDSEITIPDVAKIIGCWNGLRYPEGKKGANKPPLRRAVAFTSRIKDSEIIEREFGRIIQGALDKSPLPKDEHGLDCTVEHVDGGMNALVRNHKLDWLRHEFQGENQKDGQYECRILSNARCLSEGIDVPALDAVMFLQPKASYVDIVQAVGRVMRKSKGKNYGYIILPIAVPAGIAPHEALNDNKKYAAVWKVLQALRSHDSRFNAMINQMELNQKKPGKITTIGIGEHGEFISEPSTEDSASEGIQTEFAFSEWQNAIYTKIVDKCGDRRYWESWAQDVAAIAQTITTRIEGLLAKKDSDFASVFAVFLSSLQQNINPAIDQDEAVGMLAQHTITQPVFDALFEDYSFSKHNPVSISMERVIGYLQEQGLKNELKNLEGFYESVRERASGIDNLAGKQRIMTELYEKFFAKAFPKVSERLGIVYTPIELVDFVLKSADEVLRKEFDQGLSDKNVHVLDPFSGTGSFIVRLLQNEALVRDKDLSRKYQSEVHANEIMLLAYYIAAINIEEAFHQRSKKDYEPFSGIVLTDTFQLSEGSNQQRRMDKLFPENSQRVERQKERPIRVIVGNPPWSAGQRSENDANKNLRYETLDGRIEESYVQHSSATLRNSLYDSYIRAIRWASDRIGQEGIVAYVTNGSFIDGNAMDGLRKCLVEEFDAIYCFNLRGNARTTGDLNKREGGLIFNKGSGSKATIAISLLVKNPKKTKDKGQIYYYDIGDYLSREAKLQKAAESSLNTLDWQAISPNAANDWINQRNPEFASYTPMGTKESKALSLKALDDKAAAPGLFADSQPQDQNSAGSIFGIYSSGVKTNRDAWVYNFSQGALAKNMKGMIAFYNQQLEGYQRARRKNSKLKVDGFIDNDPEKIAWDRATKTDLIREKEGQYSKKQIRLAIYRPFCKQWFYFDRQFNNTIYRIPHFFPKTDSPNRLICVSGIGANQFSALMVDTLPDVQFAANGQCFALYAYDAKGRRHENVGDATLAAFHKRYGDRRLSKEDIFYYVYAVLHSRSYIQRFGADLVKMLPRIPFRGQTKDFRLFAKAGRELAELHCRYEHAKEYPLSIRGNTKNKRLEKMRFVKDPALKSETNKQGFDKSKIVFNPHIRIEGIPLRAYEYKVNGKPAIEWVMERYQQSAHKDSGIANDPNEWPGGGEYALSLLKRVVTVSMESVRIVEGLG